MQLTQLEIKGFKSFGDKTTLHFNEGVTAIAGPNGCGKSNVVDAIRWVLGEQSTRMLRSEKMENIIFNGSKSRKASNLAEVSLSFDNTRNILPTEFSHVTVTRKLYRTGESEYRLNDVQCRLKDITDLFLDTGIGPDSYAIIELKMIDEIIANKENSRRALFEEASGISKYKLRKKQTYVKLNDTEADLSRVEDLLFEIEKNLKTLENQARKAERYYRLKEQYKTLSIALASFRISGFRTSLDKLEQQEQQQAAERTAAVAEIDKLEAVIQQQKTDNLKQEKNLSVQQKAANEFISKIRTYESDKKVKNEQLRYLQEKETRLTDEIEKDKNQLNHVTYNLKRLHDDLVTENAALQSVQLSLDVQKQDVTVLQEQLKAGKTGSDQLSRENNDLQNQVYQLEKEIAILHIQKEALLQESTRSVADSAAKETELTESNKLIADLETRLQTLTGEFELGLQLENKLEKDIQEATEISTSHKEELNHEGRLLDALQNEYNLTKSMVDNLEGFPESIQFLKKTTSWAKQAPLFSDVLFCKEEYRVAIENYLEPVMNYYVVQNQADAVQAIKLLAEASRGRANFFILDALNQRVSKTESPGLPRAGLIPALQIIETEQRYLPLCELLLQNVYLLRQPDDAELETPLPDDKMVILSSSGKFSKSRISMAGGSVGLFEGKRIGRMKNLENLSVKIKAAQLKSDQLKTAIAELSQKVGGLKASSRKQETNKLQQEITRLNNELISVKTRQEQFVAFIKNSRDRKQDIENKITSIANELLTANPKLAALKSQKEIKNAQLAAAQQEYTELAELVSSRSSAYNQENIRFHQQQNKISGIKKDIEYRESQQNNLLLRIKASNADLSTTQNSIIEIVAHAGATDEDLTDMYKQKEEFEKGILEAEQEYYAVRGFVAETEKQLSALRKNKEQVDLLANEIKDHKNTLRLELNALKERLSVEFSVDIADLIDGETPADENEDDVRIKTGRIKKQLDEFGAINPMALEAYQEMNERYIFIQSQKKDLLDARASLMETIKEIDDTARQKFMAAFTQVREHFIGVFRSLFNEEDSCDLVLLNPENPLESDVEIMARPKGKRPLSINQLSGGEKTLTSTALLFSLYLLKPAPFCIFDEVDAPLDDTNIDKFNNIIRQFSDRSQFIIVSHNKRTLASTDVIYGVTMIEQGVSKLVAVDLRELV